MHDDLQRALDAADMAAELALRHFRQGVTVTAKADGSPVTEADRAVEELLRELLLAGASDDAILGEEFGLRGAGDGDGERVWILDPIDGTSFFARGNENWRVQVALEIAGRIEVGVVIAPALGLRWWAARGQRAWESSWPGNDGDRRRLSVSTTAKLADATLDVLNSACRSRLPASATFAAPSTTGWCTGLIRLLRGEVECFFADRYQAWDHAPWIVLVEEAGGRFTNRVGGSDSRQGGGLYSNEHLHAVLCEVVGYRPSSEVTPDA